MELLKQSKEYRVSTEEEAVALIEQVKSSSQGRVDYKSTYKTKKSKGEIIDEWYVVSITEKFE